MADLRADTRPLVENARSHQPCDPHDAGRATGSRARGVIVKAERLAKGANPHDVVTCLSHPLQ